MNISNLVKVSQVSSIRRYFEIGERKSHCFNASGPYLWLPKRNRGKFWYEYLQLHKEGICENLQVSELFDINVTFITRFKFSFDVGNNAPYTNDFVKLLIDIHHKLIDEMLEFTDQFQRKRRHICCVREASAEIINEGTYTIRLELYFPYINVKKTVAETALVPRLIELLEEEDVIEQMDRKPYGNWIDIVGSPYSCPLPLLGSCNEKLNGCYTRDSGRVIRIDPSDLLKYIDISQHRDVRNGQVNMKILKEIGNENLGMFVMPLVMSVASCVPDSTHLNNQTIETQDDNVDTNYFPTEMEMAERFIDMLSPDRVAIYSHWIAVGKCLYTVSGGTDLGLTMWIDFTKKHMLDIEIKEDFDYPNVAQERDQRYEKNLLTEETERDAQKQYFLFADNPLTVRTLAWFAHKDSPERYRKWEKRWVSSALEKSLSCSHVDTAEAVYKCYWLTYLCADIGNKVWYHFRGNTWISKGAQISLNREIRRNFRRRFLDMKHILQQQANSVLNEHRKSELEEKLRSVNCLLDKSHLGSYGWIRTVVSESSIHFYKEDISDFMDANSNLTGMANGVIEVDPTHAFFREGMPEDYISKTTGLKWEDLSENHEYIKSLEIYMEQVFPDPELRRYVKRLAASWLGGGNPQKKFTVFSGDTDASKSVFKRLVEATFGLDRYVVNVPITTLVEKRKSGPTPELSQIRNTKVIFTQEPDNDDSLRGGIMKELTGGDSMFSRKLYSDGGSLEATWQVILVCNKVPVIPNVDQAIRQRVCIVPFLSLFKRKERILTEEEKVKYGDNVYDVDPFFNKKIPKLAQAFIWMCVKNYGEFITEGSDIPQSVEMATKQYWEGADIYHVFLRESVDITEERRDKISIADLFRLFSGWHSQSYPNSAKISRHTFEHEMSQRKGKPENGYWFGIKRKDEDLRLY